MSARDAEIALTGQLRDVGQRGGDLVGGRDPPEGHVVQGLVAQPGVAVHRGPGPGRGRGGREVLEGAGGVPVEEVIKV